jgi:hypothetical protein
MKTNKTLGYLTEGLEFIEPLSNIGKLRLTEFSSTFESLEDLFKSIGANVISLSYCVDNWNVFVFFKFDLASGEILLKNRKKIYKFFTKHIPLRTIAIDWLEVFHLKEGASSFHIFKNGNYTSLGLVLNDDAPNYSFPSHDFFCLSEDLKLKNKVTELKVHKD